MKILLVLDSLKLESGVSSIVLNLYNNMNSKMFDFLIFRDSVHSVEETVKNKGSKVYKLSNPLSLRSCIKAQKEIKSFFIEHAHEYDVIHLHTPTLNQFILKYAKKYGIGQRIIHSHSTMTSLNWIKKIINMYLLRNVTKYANNFWTCSQEAAVFLYGDKFVQKHNVEWIRNAVNVEECMFDEKNRTLVRDNLNLTNKKVICHVSNFSPIKNLFFLVEVIKTICLQDSDYCFLFVGDGPVKDKFQECLKIKGLEKFVVFTGFTDRVKDYLDCSDLFLLPSFKEGLPVVAIEAQMNGLHCLLSDTITTSADLGNISYISLKAELWVRKILETSIMDNTKRNNFSKLVQFSDFNIKIEAKRVEQLYRALVEGKND